jgi:hypothetical protein
LYLPDTAGYGTVSEAFNFGITLLEHNKVDGGKIGANNATTDRFALALSLAARAVASGTLPHEERHTSSGQNTLLHGKTLLVVTARDAENVALEFLTKLVTFNFGGHALVVKDTGHKEIVSTQQAQQANKKAYRSFFSSSMSMHFSIPVAGFAMLS